MSNIDNSDASVLKRLYALIYDGFLLLATDMILVLLPASFLITFKGIDPQSGLYMASVITAILLVHYLFYGWFWTHGGQTLGMRAWKLKLVTEDGRAVSWGMALKRFLLGMPAWILLVTALLDLFTLQQAINIAILIFGLMWWVLDNRAALWRETVSQTRVVQLPKA